jgi:cytochrome c oxidase subunit 1
MSSQSPVPTNIRKTNASQYHITFLYFILKDITSTLLLLTITISIALFTMLTLSHPINMIPINSLVTPSHIVPEWYFLYLYSILKVIPNKLGGILGIIISLLFILLITTSTHSYNINTIFHIGSYNSYDIIIGIVLSYIYLSYIGLQLPIAPYVMNCRLVLILFTLPLFIISIINYTYNIINSNRISTNIISTNNYISLLSSTNHKRIGLYYLLTSSYIAIMGIILSIIMRIELSSPSSTIIASSNISFYNYSISNHGLLMLLFIVMPIVFGAFGNYLLVLSLGLIDIIFPRINNLGWLILILSYLLIQCSILTEYLTGAGWTLYPPLSTITSTFIISSMYLALSISGISSLLTSINYLLLLPHSQSNITYDLLLISFIITSIMVLYSIPVLAGAFLLATSDILLTTSYFSNYSDPVLYQHLFWFFGHPEVYILILPSFGLINYQLSSLTSNYIFGTISMIIALISILLFGTIVWSHHMFTVNLESDTNLYFTILTLIIAIPTGTKLYNWLYVVNSSFTNNPAGLLSITLAYIFLIIVIQGGVTGVVLGNNILDLQLHDTYYVVSHFHYILSVATVVSIILTLFYLSNYFNALRITPLLYSSLTNYSILTIFILLNTIFLPMYFLGFNTMPRRIPDYADYLQAWNSISSVSVIAFYIAIAILILS